VIHGKKSQFEPKKCITFLGNVINSKEWLLNWLRRKILFMKNVNAL
jgi:hypothetical protein